MTTKEYFINCRRLHDELVAMYEREGRDYTLAFIDEASIKDRTYLLKVRTWIDLLNTFA